ncbi:hypothetical protein E6C50_02410 [Flavobacterium supellecticarium]|uniref:Uncharacterized protein n=1 Tax=Flavobacterium supellecticarium TaxID=2565924 RepID=A0A4S4A3R0_9FLAO|nr:hypothetical protein [Flavobacterium supellecticarium]THF53077.1 hypothetical protein E6C50_02410 [Flavobacterium supellecticarium]
MNALKQKAAVLFLLFLLAETVHSQTFISYQDLMTNNGYGSKKEGSAFDYDHVKSLLKELHPKLYILNGKEKNLTQGNLYYAEVDATSFRQLLAMDNIGSLEMLTLKLSANDAARIDPTALEKFKNLKYIYIICDFKCNPDYIKSLFLNNRHDYLIIYSISIPS